MKKIISSLLVVFLLTFFFQEIKYANTNTSANQETISNKLIRFHVIANSDSEQDQSLKLKVRDAVLEYMYPKLKNSKNISESRKILKDNNSNIIQISKKIIENNGFQYNVTTSLGRDNFPIKTYGCITLPQGNYEAYKIIIGNGQGHNWWCVMFPPLCFIDITKGETSQKETEKQMKKTLTNNEYKLVDNTEHPKSSNNTKITFKFKTIEILHKLKLSL